MNGFRRIALVLALALGMWGGGRTDGRAAGPGQEDLDEALREKITAQDLRDVNKVIDLLQSAVDKGLEDEDAKFADQMLAETLMQRATQLVAVLDRVGSQQAQDEKLQQLRSMAVSDLRRVLAAENPPSVAKLMLGKLQVGPGGDPHEAKRLLSDFVKNEAESAEDRAVAFALRAQLQSDPQRRDADLDEAIKLEPENPRYRLARAALLRQNGDLDEALADANAVLAEHADELAAYVLVGEILREQEKFADALAVLEKAALSVPESPLPYQQRGEILRQQGETAKAIDEFTKVLTLAPDAVLTLIHRAEAYLAEEKYPEAMADVDAALSKQPGLLAGLRLRAQVLAAEDKLDEAIIAMRELVAAAPQAPELQMQLALYCVIAKQPREAIEAYNAVLKDDPQNFLALRARGDAYLNLGEHDLALADFNKAIDLEPSDTTLLNNLAWLLATSPEADVRDGQRAIKLAEQACQLTDHKAAHILSTLAAAFAETGDFAKAKEWSQKAVDLGTDEYDGQLEKELASYEAGKPWRERQNIEDEPAAGDDEQPAAGDEPSPDEPAGDDEGVELPPATDDQLEEAAK